jgi:hypothetical protein
MGMKAPVTFGPKTDRPAQLEPLPPPRIANIPGELIERRQWVTWKREIRDGRVTKVLYQARNPKYCAKTNDPSTWATFDEAWDCYQRGGFDGVGYVFAPDDPFVGVDVDKCLKDGKLLDWAIPFVEQFKSTYGEISPSDTGIKFFARGKLPGDGKKRVKLGPDETGAIEAYDQRRYFTVTGNQWGEVQDIADLNGALTSLYEFVCVRPEPKETFEERKKKHPFLMRANDGDELTDEERASLYLAKVESAIDGSGGSDVTFRAAAIGHEFGIEAERWLQILSVEYNPRCVGPWTEKDLRKKVFDAYGKADKPLGWRVAESSKSTSTNSESRSQAGGKTSNEAPSFDGVVLKPITPALAPVPELGAYMIPQVFRAWLEDIADRACLPLAYAAAAMIVALSGLIGRRLGIKPKRYDDWLVICNLWGAIVGPPGFLKTPAVDAVMRPLKRLVADAMKAHEDAVKAHNERLMVATARKAAAKKNLDAAAKKKESTDAELQELAKLAMVDAAEDEPKCKRYLVNDFTVEKLGEMLAENPNGLTVLRDELTGLLSTLKREGHQSDRGFLLECWNGTGSYTFDRIGRGTQHIKAACLALFGTIQPGPLARYMQGTIKGDEADGFIPRFQVLVYPDPPGKYEHVDRWPNKDAKNDAYAVYQAIDQLNAADKGCATDDDSGLPYVNFTPEAQAFFDGWYTELQNRLRGGELTDVMKAHLAKYGSLMPSLALIFHLVENCQAWEIEGVSLEAAQMAAAWCDYLEAHARRVYLLCADGDISAAVTLAERIKGSLTNPFTPRELAQKGWSGLSTVEDARHAVGILEDRGWVKVVEIKSDDSKGRGRPSETVWINPKVLVTDGGVSA